MLTACAHHVEKERARELRVEGRRGSANEGSFAQNQIKSSIEKVKVRGGRRGVSSDCVAKKKEWTCK